MTIVIRHHIDHYYLVTINGKRTLYVRAQYDVEAMAKVFDYLAHCGGMG